MSILNEDQLLGAPGSSQYQIQRSLRFNSADSAYLSRTFGTPTTQGTFTFSCWLKRSAIGTAQAIFGVSTNHSLGFTTGSDNSVLELKFAGTTALQTTALFRDPCAWYHLVWTQSGTAHTIYVNNASVGTATATSSVFNTAVAHQIGAANTANYLSGYLADIHFIDGQALTPASFGETDATTGEWIPKAYTGSYGTNGFKLNFSNNSAATATTLGADSSGNGNNWTPTNLSVTAGAGNDSLVDTPTSYGTDTGVGGEVRGNYCTWNPLDKGANIVLSNGNLDLATSTAAWFGCRSTIGMSTGKWYFEAVITATSTGNPEVGVATAAASMATYTGANAMAWSYAGDGKKYNSNSGTTYGATFGLNDVIGVAFDADNGTLSFYKNGVSQGTAFTGLTSGPYFFTISLYNTNTWTTNFGQRQWAYAAPAGFKALCDTNLPAPTIAKPSTVMDVKLYTGNTTGQTISGLGFNPDLVWFKSRGAAYSHQLYDSVRGGTASLSSNSTTAEVTRSGAITAFNSDGFTIGNEGGINDTSITMAAWCWDAGSSTVTNTAGTISSQVRANPSAGFSVVTWTSNGIGSTYTKGHGLNVAPSLVIIKNRDLSDNWWVYFPPTSSRLFLNTTAAAVAATGFSASSTTFGNDEGSIALNGQRCVAYCFAPVAGYSAAFSWTGNNSTDGPFCFLGFRPALLLLKQTTAASATNWVMLDCRRAGYNVDNDPLWPNLANAEGTTDLVDITSNGFKIRTTDTSVNASSGTYVGFAWAEFPLQYARAR